MSNILNSLMVKRGGAPPTPAEGWNPPADWLWTTRAAATPANGATILMPLFEKSLNLFAFTAWFSGTATVNFNDGAGEHAVISGTRFDYAVDYAAITTDVSGRGYKLTPVVLTCSEEFTRLSFNSKHPQQLLYVAQAMKAIKVNTTTAGKFTFSSSKDNAQWVEILDFGAKNIAAPYLMYNQRGLNRLVCDISGSGDMYNMFTNANISNIDVTAYDYSGFANLDGIFTGAFGGDGVVFNKSIAACTSMASMFRQNSCFGEANLTDTRLVTNISYALNNSSIRVFTMDDCSSVMKTAQFIVNYGQLQQLEWLELHGMTVGIDLSNLPMDATALNNFFTSLGTANGSQTIIITGCLGVEGCDTGIATDKKYTVTA